MSDGCLFILTDPTTGATVGLAGLHVDDFLIGGIDENKCFAEAFSKLEAAYRWGKWEMDSFTFAGCSIKQPADKSIRIDQTEYSDRWIDELEIPADRAKIVKLPATSAEISQLRGLIGTMAWRSSQTSPQFQADVGLLLSEIPYATVSTLLTANKLVREMKRTPQSLLFPSWRRPWQELAVVVWADASNSNRPDKSSTLGLVAGLAPDSIMSGEQ